MPKLVICGFCKKVGAGITHTLVKFPTGLVADAFTCADCGAVVSISRAPVEQPTIVAPSQGQIEKLSMS